LIENFHTLNFDDKNIFAFFYKSFYDFITYHNLIKSNKEFYKFFLFLVRFLIYLDLD